MNESLWQTPHADNSRPRTLGASLDFDYRFFEEGLGLPMVGRGIWTKLDRFAVRSMAVRVSPRFFSFDHHSVIEQSLRLDQLLERR